MAERKVVLITGANTGLGLEIVKALCQSTQSYSVLVGCRTLSKGESAIDSVKTQYPSTNSSCTAVQIDLASDQSLEQAIDMISTQYDRLDALVNNGGAAYDHEIGSGTLSIREGWNKSWDTNVSGTQVLTTYAVPLLLKAADPRLIFMTSGTASLAETESSANEMMKRLNAVPPKGWPKQWPHNPAVAYRSSKTGLNMLMREWTSFLKNDGVKVWAVSPGFLATNLNGADPETLRKFGALDPAIGGGFVVDVIEGKRDEDVGKLIRKDMIQPW